jgi:esterase
MTGGAGKYITNGFSKYLGGMKLFFRVSGEGQPLIILHGLFGSSDNWYTLAKTFATTNKVFVVDQRNHGQSPHSDEINYKVLAEDVREFISDQGIELPVVIGHSMGGKTAMNLAVKYPALIDALIVVDIVPKSYPMRHDKLLEGMKAIPLTTITSRHEADALLVPFAPDLAERQFILKNLVRTSAGFSWKINLPALEAHLDDLGRGMEYDGHFDRPTLFIRGKNSPYFDQGDEQVVRKFFPKAEFETLDTGHWVQAEKPDQFAQTVRSFLRAHTL